MRRQLFDHDRAAIGILDATGHAEIGANAPACIVALNCSGAGAPLGRAATLTAENCAVASEASLTLPRSTTITTETVNHDLSAASRPCTGVAIIEPLAEARVGQHQQDDNARSRIPRTE